MQNCVLHIQSSVLNRRRHCSKYSATVQSVLCRTSVTAVVAPDKALMGSQLFCVALLEYCCEKRQSTTVQCSRNHGRSEIESSVGLWGRAREYCAVIGVP